MKQHRDGPTDDPTCFLDILRWRALQQAERTAFTFGDGDGDGDGDGGGDAGAELRLTYGELDRRARVLGARLQELGLGGERALLVYPPGLEFLAAFFGCLYAGVVAVPAYPPRPNRPLARLRAIVADCRPAAVLTTEDLLAEGDRWCAQAPELEEPRWLATDGGLDFDDAMAEAWVDPRVGRDTLAFLQYTSGSTAAAKGVMVSHGNLVHNSALIRDGFASGAESRGVFWLPLYHDMGLIGGVLQTLYCGGTSALLSPVAFLQRPVRWLRAISRTRATISGGPNFAFDLCVRKVTDDQRAGLDLGSWTVAFNGAEPIRAETLDRFTERFAPCGFRREAFLPCYGLAETTLLVSGGPAAAKPVVVPVAAAPLGRDRVERVEPGAPGARALVGSGAVPAGLEVAIVDPRALTRSDPGRIGEIWVAGPSVALGYWERPEATAETFGATLDGSGEGPFLRTGDLGFLDGGELVVTGRLKDLIIVRGRNVYPQDVEWTVERSHPALRAEGGAAFAVEANGQERLVVVHEVDRHVKAKDAAEVVRAIRRAVAEQHELDVHAVCLIKAATLPKTSSGKVQRHACRERFLAGTLEAIATSTHQPGDDPAAAPAGEAGATAAAPSRALPRAADLEAWLIGRLAAILALDPGKLDTRTPFAGLGLGSLQAVGLAGELQDWLGRSLSPTLIYEYPTIEALARHLAGEPGAAAGETPCGPAPAEPIAVIGIGCRFPGAEGPEAFWRLLRDGVDAVGAVPGDRWDPDEASPRAGRGVPRWGGFLDQVDRFDADFFGISPREAVRTDPQQRLLLEVAWEALEDAGHAPDRLAGTRAGVFVGISTNDYGRLQWGRADSNDAYIVTGNAASLAANRLSYVLDFRGPSLAVDTACSSSLVAVHLACQSLRSGEATIALAGGVNVLLSPEIAANFAEAGFLAPDGRCKPFDARANGYVRGEGAGLVVLKPLARALADGDPIRAVIRGGAVNQDGRSNGLTAPSPQAQEAVLREAYRASGVAPGRVQYVEAHGSGTPLGDPIEARALGGVLGAGRAAGEGCHIGSVKSNIGHLEAAAGVAGLIKAVLALEHRAIPPSLHFDEPNPHIPFDELALRVPRALTPWPAAGGEGPALAGVSAFGFGGTNAHLVLEEAPRRRPGPSIAAGDAPHAGEALLLPLSARGPEALEALAERYRQALGDSLADVPLGAIAATLGLRRSHHGQRLAIVARTHADAAAQLAAPLVAAGGRRGAAPRPRLVFVCTGQGSAWQGAGRGLLHREPAFARALEACDACFAPLAGWSLAEAIAEGREARGGLVQPLTLALQVALAAVWRSWGIVPEAIVGHSLGEVAAAHLAGALSLEDAFRVVYHRGRLMARAAGHGLAAALGVSEQEAEALVAAEPGRLFLAALNGPGAVTVSGAPEAVRAAVATLQGQGRFARLLDGDTAFHSPHMDPVLDELAQSLAGLAPRAASIPLVSTVTGEAIAGESLDAAYWVRNVRETVRFSAAVAALTGDRPAALLELGPHPSLGAAMAQHLRESGRPGTTLASLRRGEDDRATMLRALATLYTLGLDLDWQAVAPPGPVPCVRLPAYPWTRRRFWLEPADESSRRNGHHTHDATTRNGNGHGNGHALGYGNGHAAGKNGSAIEAEAEAEDWVSVLAWKRRDRTAPAGENGRRGPWLVLADRRGVGEAVRARLEALGVACDLVPCAGLDPQGFRARLEARAYHGVVHLGSLDGETTAEPSLDDLAEAQAAGAGSVLQLAQALAASGGSAPPRLWLATRGAQPAAGRGPGDAHEDDAAGVSPGRAFGGLGQAPVWGMGRSIGLEQPASWGGLVDLDPDDPPDASAAALAEELIHPDGEDQIALRRGGRYVARLVRHEASDRPAARLTIRPDGTYLVTGGLGELGLQTARWLAARGARRLVLLGRRPLPGRAEWDRLADDDPARGQVAAIRGLEQLGATVVLAALDVADAPGMSALFERLAETLPPIRGIVHAAGSITPATARDLDPAGLAAVLRPKVAGTWVLHGLARDLPLDFFVLYSSVAAVLGARELHYAAANQFLDAYAEAARGEGRPALSVNWGPWAHAGMGASAERTRAFAILGIRPLEPERALRLLEGLAGEGADRAVVVVADADWAALKRIQGEDGRRRLLDDRQGHDAHHRNGRDSSVPRNGDLARWRSAPIQERRERLVGYFRARVAGVLRLEPDRIDPARPLNTLGLDSLTAIELKGGVEADLGTTLPLSSLMQGPTLADLAEQTIARWEDGEPAAAAAPLSDASEPGPEHPLSRGQESIWYVHRLDPSGAVYNIAGAARVPAELDVEALRRSLQRLVDRHPSLRTRFAEVGGRPVQRVDESAAVWFRVEDASGWGDEAVRRRLAEEADRPFDLEAGPVFRTSLFTRSPREHFLLLSVHHIASDFWSVAVLLHELGVLMAAEREGAAPALEPLEFRYTDYARRQAAMLAGPEGERLWAYWRDQLAGPLPTLALPTDRPRPALPSYRGSAVALRLEPGLTRRLARLGEARGASLYVTLLAAFQALLARLTGQEDLIVGSPVAGRDRKGLAGMVGNFVNPLPLRADLSGDPTFSEFLGRVRRTVHEGLEHQEFPFALMAERLEQVRDPGRSPLFQVLFTFQKAQRLDKEGLTPFALREHGPRLDLGGFPLESVALDQRTARFDLALTAAEAGGGLSTSLEYSTDLFDEATIARMLDRFRMVLEAVADDPDRRLSELSLLSDDERRRLLLELSMSAQTPAEGTAGGPAGDLDGLSDEQVDSLLQSLLVNEDEA